MRATPPGWALVSCSKTAAILRAQLQHSFSKSTALAKVQMSPFMQHV